MFGNERDIEVPQVLAFVERRKPRNILDVGAHSSHATYAPGVRQRIAVQPGWATYQAIDRIHDPQTEAVVDKWFTDDFVRHDLPDTFDAVLCVSVIEHVGIKPWRSDTWWEERLLLFYGILRAARHAALITAPFGTGVVTNEYACVTEDELATWVAIAQQLGWRAGMRFWISDHPQGGPDTYREILLDEAAREGKAGVPFCVMVMELVRE